MTEVPSVGALRAHLPAARLAGTVATSRERSPGRYRLFAAGDPRVLLGLVPDGEWTVPRPVRSMAGACGVSADPEDVFGSDTIAPERTIVALDAFADRLGRAARDRVPVLSGTGHPHRLLGFYVPLAKALSAAGCPVLTSAEGRRVDMVTRFGVRPHRLRYVRGVALIHEEGVRVDPGAPGAHSHSPLPVRMVLDVVADAGGPLPGLVIEDHGWVCGAGQLGIEAMGPGDTDDPAGFVARAEGRVCVAVPMDDGAPSVHYRPLARYVLNRSRLSHWRAVGHPLPPLHHPPLTWGWSAHATRSRRRGSRCPTCAEGSGVTWLLTRGL